MKLNTKSAHINFTMLSDRAMRKEDNSPQGKIVTELLQHLHACKNNCDVFYGREDELEKMKEYITGPSQKVGRKLLEL